MTTTVPTPAALARLKAPAAPIVAARHEPDEVADQVPASVIKAKQLKRGMHVKAWLTIKGVPQACGGVHVVGTVSPVSPEGTVDVVWASLHPAETYKAARRFYVVQEA